KRGLAYALHASIETFHDAGTFEVEAACHPRKAAAVIKAVLETLAELRDDLVPREELARAQRRHRMLLEFSQDSPGDLCGWFGGTELFRRPESFEERCAVVEAQTPARVQEVARRYFTRANLTAVAVGPRRGLRE